MASSITSKGTTNHSLGLMRCPLSFVNSISKQADAKNLCNKFSNLSAFLL